MTTIRNNNPKLRIPRKMLLVLSILAALFFSSHFYIFERLSYYLQLTDNSRIFLALVLAGLSLLTLIGLPLSRTLSHKTATMMSWIIYPWMGIAFMLFTTMLVTDMVWLLLKLIPKDHLPEQAILKFWFGITALSVVCLLGLLSLWKGLHSFKIKPVNIKLKRLPQSFDGFKIVQITDLHVGPLIKGKWVRRVVNKVNALKPDMIVITGDLVDGSVEELSNHVAPLADLQAPHGTYFVTGNHEYYSGVTQWCHYVASLGVRVLRNERVSIARGSESFDLVGVDDWASRQADLPKAVAGRDPNKLLILLAHQPAAADEAARYGVDLQLSGHTHAGQIWPFKYLVFLQQPYAQGLHHHQDTQTQVYVSSGTGFWGPPMRLGTSAEITLITLRT